MAFWTFGEGGEQRLFVDVVVGLDAVRRIHAERRMTVAILQARHAGGSVRWIAHEERFAILTSIALNLDKT